MTARGVRPILVRTDGNEQLHTSATPLRFGRAPEVDVFLDHPLVSRIHAELSWTDRWILADNHSTNGLFLGEHRVEGPLAIDGPIQVRFGDPGTGPVVSLIPEEAQPAGTSTSQPLAGPSTLSPPQIPLAGLRIGRTPDNDIVIDDVLASRNHARLVPTPHGVGLEDLGSVNGTYVNGTRVQRCLLTDGDVVTIGNVDAVMTDGALTYRRRVTEEAGLGLHGVGFTVEENKQLLIDVHMAARPGSLTALIGPSGAGKSTLAKLLAGTEVPTMGLVSFDGHNLHAEYDALRSRIGMVPQDDVLHRQLTVHQALRYAAELRLPPDTTTVDHDAVISGVLTELGLTEHAGTRIDRLSGGQRKRASVALELLTGPSLLILDEPTSGLDPALDRQVMTMLRHLADAGRIIIVVTHSLTYLSLCDHVLLLAPGGKTAYAGTPHGVREVMGTENWADIFARVSADPDGVFARYRQQHPHNPPPPPSYGPAGTPPRTSTGKQLSTVARRQVRLILADRGYLTFLVVLPFVLGALSLVVPGSAGFTPAGPDAPTEPTQVLVLLVLGACFMGLSLSVRDLVGERSIFRRERAVGLLPAAYLAAKTTVFCGAVILQSLVLVSIVYAGKGLPQAGAVVPSGAVEMFVAIAATACTCVIAGLTLSSVARSNEQVMPLLVVAIMIQLVMCGGLIPVTQRAVLDQISWLFPARWGFAAAASTIDLREIAFAAPGQPAPVQQDALWEHTPGIWALDIAMLVLLGAVLSVVTLSRLQLKTRR